MPRTRSAAKIVSAYANGVRDMVDKKRCPPGWKDAVRIAIISIQHNRTYLDQFTAYSEKFRGIIDVFNDLH